MKYKSIDDFKMDFYSSSLYNSIYGEEGQVHSNVHRILRPKGDFENYMKNVYFTFGHFIPVIEDLFLSVKFLSSINTPRGINTSKYLKYHYSVWCNRVISLKDNIAFLLKVVYELDIKKERNISLNKVKPMLNDQRLKASIISFEKLVSEIRIVRDIENHRKVSGYKVVEVEITEARFNNYLRELDNNPTYPVLEELSLLLRNIVTHSDLVYSDLVDEKLKIAIKPLYRTELINWRNAIKNHTDEILKSVLEIANLIEVKNNSKFS